MPDGDQLLYYPTAAHATDAANALGSLSLAELLRVTVVSLALFEFEVRTERRIWSFRAESEKDLLAWVDWLQEQVQARKSTALVLPIEGFMRKRGEHGIRAMKVDGGGVFRVVAL